MGQNRCNCGSMCQPKFTHVRPRCFDYSLCHGNTCTKRLRCSVVWRTFDALVVVDAFSLDHRKYSKDIYVKDWVSRFGHASDARYIPAQLTAEVKAAWVTLYLLRVESDRLSPGASSTSRWLAPIVYINSEGGGTFTFDDPSDSSWESGFMGFCTSSKLATRLLVNALVKDMRSIDPENWE
jgi:hypothetical protein